MIQRRGLQEIGLTVAAIYVYPEADMVVYLEQDELVHELPVSTQSPVGRRPQWSGLLVCEVGLRVDEPD